MTTLAAPPFGPRVLEHLEQQVASARRLLAAVLAQGAAIRARDVELVVDRLAAMQAEMAGRGRLEEARRSLLTEAGDRLGQPAGAVTLDGLLMLVEPASVESVRKRSAELRGLLDQVAREHGVNRALMRQELAFLDHLTRLLGQEPQAGYRPPRAANGNGPGWAGAQPGSARANRHVLDLEA